MNSSVPSGDLVRAGVSNPAGSLAEARKSKVDWVDWVDWVDSVDSGDPGGPAKLCPPQRRDRRLAFTRKKSKLNTKSPPRGAAKKFVSDQATDPRPFHAESFFPASRIFRRRPRRARRIRESIQGPATEPRSRTSIYFQMRPGGGQKSGTSQARTGGLPAKTFPRISETFFWPRSTARRSRRQKKSPRN